MARVQGYTEHQQEEQDHDEAVVTLRWLQPTGEQVTGSLLRDDLAVAFMRQLGIEPAPERSQLARWLEAMAQENGLDLDVVKRHVRSIIDPVAVILSGAAPHDGLPEFVFILA